jgi:hypothetical protein
MKEAPAVTGGANAGAFFYGRVFIMTVEKVRKNRAISTDFLSVTKT